MTVQGEELDNSGMLWDFKEMREALDDAVSGYDHEYLNQIPPFDDISPTAENLARHIYLTLRKKVVSRRLQLVEITVWESAEARASYSE